MFSCVEEAFGVPRICGGQRGRGRVVQPIDEPRPRRRIVGDHSLNGFRLQLDPRILGFFPVPGDQAARNAQEIRGFDELNGAALHLQPLFIGPRLAFFGALDGHDRGDRVPEHVGVRIDDVGHDVLDRRRWPELRLGLMIVSGTAAAHRQQERKGRDYSRARPHRAQSTRHRHEH